MIFGIVNTLYRPRTCFNGGKHSTRLRNHGVMLVHRNCRCDCSLNAYTIPLGLGEIEIFGRGRTPVFIHLSTDRAALEQTRRVATGGHSETKSRPLSFYI